MNKITGKLTLSTGKHWPSNVNKMLTAAWRWQKDVIITITEDAETRRDKQNKLMWKWHSELAKHILESQGQTFSSDDIHEWIVEKLLPKNVVTLLNEPVITRTKTSKLKVGEFAKFLTHYESFVNETYNCKFTRPDDLYLEAVRTQNEVK